MGKRGKADRQTVLMNYKLWLTSITGNGKIEESTFFILKCLKENPDLTLAAKQVNISLSQAQQLIQDAEAISGASLAEIHNNQTGKQTAHLTAAGEKLLEAYQSLKKNFDPAFEDAFEAYTNRQKTGKKPKA